MASAASVAPKITLHFGWTGPNSLDGGFSRGGSDINVIDVKFRDSSDEVSVHLPDGITSTAAQRFPFTHRTYFKSTVAVGGRQTRVLNKEIQTYSLNVPVDLIRHLTINAGLFRQGPSMGPRFMSSYSGRVSQQMTARRIDQPVPLEIPEVLESGQTYRLEMTSEGPSLSARLIKEETSSPGAA